MNQMNPTNPTQLSPNLDPGGPTQLNPNLDPVGPTQPEIGFKSGSFRFIMSIIGLNQNLNSI